MQAVGVPLVEPTVIPDTFCTGLGRIESLGSALRFTFFVHQRSVCADGMERVVVARLVLPVEAVTSVAMQALAATGTMMYLGDERAH